jgi:hypothetical protein
LKREEGEGSESGRLKVSRKLSFAKTEERKEKEVYF